MVNERQPPRLSGSERPLHDLSHPEYAQRSQVAGGFSQLPAFHDLQATLSDWNDNAPSSYSPTHQAVQKPLPDAQINNVNGNNAAVPAYPSTSRQSYPSIQPSTASLSQRPNGALAAPPKNHHNDQLPLNDRTNTADIGRSAALEDRLKAEKARTHGGLFMPKSRVPSNGGLSSNQSGFQSYTDSSHGFNAVNGAFPQRSQFTLASAGPQPFAANHINAAPRPLYSTGTGFQAVNSFKQQPRPSNMIDLTKPAAKHPDDGFDPDKVLADSRFGSTDPYTYVDSAQASENIKNLLEGAFEEDEEDKPRTRLRQRKQRKAEDKCAADELANKVQGLKVQSGPEGKQREEPEEDEEDGSVEGLSVKLLPHQIDGVAWMLDKEIGERKRNGVLPKGGILADDMGLGKTIQALALIMSNLRPSREDLATQPKRKIPEVTAKGTLVVAPLALIRQWETEIKDKVSWERKLKVLVHHGTSRTKRYDDLKKYDVVITTYQTLTSEHESCSGGADGIKVGCFGLHWFRVILDEAHSIKNRNAKMTKAAYALNAVYRWCLTGTPMQNGLDELQSLIRFLQIKPYNDLAAWKDQISSPMKNGRGGLAMKRLQYFLKAFMKRRTKDILKREGALRFGKGVQRASENGEVEKDRGFKIVGRQVETLVADFSKNERGFYDRLAARTEKSLESMIGGQKNDYIGALVLLLRLRQTCNHPDLIRGNLHKERDSMGSGSSSQSKSKAQTGEVDDMADMFGALSVETKKCDICQVVLDDSRATAGEIRCPDCEDDLKLQKEASLSRRQKRDKKHRKAYTSNPMRRRNFHSGRVVESDEENGDWVIPRDQRVTEDLGKAGGAANEDAEGGGIWLNSEDETGSENGSAREADSSSEAGSESASPHSAHPHTGQKPSSAASTKIRRLLDLLAKESSTHKFIIFSEFTSMLDLVTPHLRRAGYSGVVRYDGSMPNVEREASLHALRNDSSCRILLCSLRCGSLGLNLTSASRVVLMEPFWNPFVEEQAIDRVHRLNQTRDVVVYRLTIRDSVEERILDLQERKRELAKAAIEGGSSKGVGKLNMKDIMALFGRNAEHDGSHDTASNIRPTAGRGDMLSGATLSSAERERQQLQEKERKETSERERAKFRVPYGLANSNAATNDAFARRW